MCSHRLADHCILMEAKVQMVSTNKTRTIVTRPLKDSSLQVCEQLISQQRWSTVYSSPCIKSKVDAFLAATSETINIVFPLKTFKVHENDKLFYMIEN